MGIGGSTPLGFEGAFHPLSPSTDRKFYDQLNVSDPTLFRMLTGSPDPAAIEYYYSNRYQDPRTAESAHARAAIRYAAALRGIYRLFAFAQGPADYDLYQTQCLQLGFAQGTGPDRMSHFISERTKKLIQDHVLQALELSLVPSSCGGHPECFPMTYVGLKDHLEAPSFLPLAGFCLRVGREDAIALIVPEIQRLSEDRSYAPYARLLAAVAVEICSIQVAPASVSIGNGPGGLSTESAPPADNSESTRKQAACVLLRSLGLSLEDLIRVDPRCEALRDRLAPWF